MQEDIIKIDKILRHKKNVQENTELVGKKLIEQGEVLLGRQLIAAGWPHDVSKFFGLEWDNLFLEQDCNENSLKLSDAIKQHNKTNTHHPEYWDGIKNMPRLYVAEMVCDWAARSSEFGESLMDWIKKGAMERYQFTARDKVYKEIKYFAALLCDKPFKQTNK